MLVAELQRGVPVPKPEVEDIASAIPRHRRDESHAILLSRGRHKSR